MSGTRSSRVSSTIFLRLRSLDRKITEIDKLLIYHKKFFAPWTQKELKKLWERRNKLDQKRKEIRIKRKNETISLER
jgi:hypothetical protein